MKQTILIIFSKEKVSQSLDILLIFEFKNYNAHVCNILHLYVLINFNSAKNSQNYNARNYQPRGVWSVQY